MNIRSYFESKQLKEILTKKLTRREVEILSLYASGFSVGEISNILTVSKNTIRTHIKNVFLKIEIPQDANPKITLCLFYLLFRTEITKMGGFKYAKRE
jgi:DNA-binding NarL/FixJ family response regulator